MVKVYDLLDKIADRLKEIFEWKKAIPRANLFASNPYIILHNF